MRIHRDSTVGVIVDIQERLHPHMHEADRQLAKTLTLMAGLQTLEVPLLLTEQYPKGLGPTLEAVRTGMGEAFAPLEKASFSCCDDPGFMTALQKHKRRTVLLAGIETHVCVLQTAMDLLEAGMEPVLVLDASSSRNPLDRDVAARRIEREGGRVTTVESILFELTRMSGTPTFKEISRLVK